MNNFEKVKQFHRAFLLEENIDKPSDELLHNRVAFIEEELNELKQAIELYKGVPNDWAKSRILDALGDILYTTYGCGVVLGFDMNGAFDEIHRSNISKLCESGKPIIAENGKVIKSDQYTPPDLIKFINNEKEKGE